jgi:hypothetical protein
MSGAGVRKLPTVCIFLTAYFPESVFKIYSFRPVSILFYEYDMFMKSFLFSVSVAGRPGLPATSVTQEQRADQPARGGIHEVFPSKDPKEKGRDVHFVLCLSFPYKQMLVHVHIETMECTLCTDSPLSGLK